MKPKTLLVLAVVVAALAAFIAFYERDLPSSDERRERAGRALSFDAADLTELSLEWGDRTVRFERDAEPAASETESPFGAAQPGWRIVVPIENRADRSAVDRLAGDLAGLKIERTLADAERGEAGLEPPRGRVRWKTAGGEGTLEVGGKVPASSNVVVASSSRDGLLVVPGYFVEQLEKAPGEWRAREVVDATRDQIQRITLAPAGGERVVLVERGNDGFGVEAPFSDVADRGLVDPLLSDLVALKVGSFVDPPLPAEAEAALAGGAGRIELGIEGRDAPVAIEVGAEAAPGGERYFRAGGTAFRGRSNLVEALAREADAWRSKNWASFDSFRIESLRATDESSTTELVRSSGDWLRDGTKIAYPVAGDLLYAVTSAKADRIVGAEEAAAYPVESPTLTIALTDGNGAEELLTLHGATSDGSFAARVSGRDVVLLLPADKVGEIREKLAAVRAAEAVDVPVAAGPEAAATPTP